MEWRLLGAIHPEDARGKRLRGGGSRGSGGKPTLDTRATQSCRSLHLLQVTKVTTTEVAWLHHVVRASIRRVAMRLDAPQEPLQLAHNDRRGGPPAKRTKGRITTPPFIESGNSRHVIAEAENSVTMSSRKAADLLKSS